LTQARPSSRLPGFYRHDVTERLTLLQQAGWLSAQDCRSLQHSTQILTAHCADKMIENVVGVLGLPLALGLNFVINQREVVVPLAVEEPSIVAALGAAAKVVRGAGGFTTSSGEPLLIGQVQVVDVAHPTRAQHAVLENRQQILNLANSLHPKMVARGGGARDVEVRLLPAPGRGSDMLVVHLLVDTCDAMGANLVNTMCEGVAGLIAELTHGRVFLRILSNLTDRALVRARAVVGLEQLKTRQHSGEQVRDGIILANDFAIADPYRAVTHNKGIMNGIDAVALATGNDWRAIEAAAHAYAGRGASYTALTRWTADAEGNLVGDIELPLKVGTVGGNLQSNPAVAIAHRILASGGGGGARWLAEVMGAVGLAQNFAALRALATEGIQQGHMTLHARSVVMSAGTPPALFDQVLKQLVHSGEIKVWKAQEIAAALQPAAVADAGTGAQAGAGAQGGATQPAGTLPTGGGAAADLATSSAIPAGIDPRTLGRGHGKIVLLGEHAVVFGKHALAAPIALSIWARVQEASVQEVQLMIPSWGVEGHLRHNDAQNTLHSSLNLILTRLNLPARNLIIEVFPEIPRAVGLGSSGALAVAVIRALSLHFRLNLPDTAVDALAFEVEKLAHGTPSGVGNTVATYGKLLLFDAAHGKHQTLQVKAPVQVVVGFTGVESLTAKMVAQVSLRAQRSPALYQKLFADIDALTLAGAEALQAGRLEELGELININHGLLGALQVSSWETEELVGIARQNGALGAKLTGSGGGGAVLALCQQPGDNIVAAMRQAGYQALATRFC
jgi:hydroxymethylglutaryl-CoA reductase